MLRLILALLPAVIFLIFGIPVLGILWLVRKWKPQAADRCTLRLVQGVFRIMLFASGVKTTVIGEEHVPKDQAVLYVINHRSYFDVLLTYVRCPGLTGYIAKKEIKKLPLVPLWMNRLYCLFLDRDDIRAGMKMVLTAIDYIKSGISLAVFPEGTRGRSPNEEELLPFHEGSFKIAQKTGCPIIPVCISHSSAIMEDHMPWIRSTHVVIEYKEPIYPDQLSKEEKKFLGKHVQTIMQETLLKNKSVL